MKSAILILLISLSTWECSTILQVCPGALGNQGNFDPKTAGSCYDIQESIRDTASYGGGFSWDDIKYGYTESTPWELYDETDYAGNRWVFTPGVKVEFKKGYKSLRPACEYSSKGKFNIYIGHDRHHSRVKHNSSISQSSKQDIGLLTCATCVGLHALTNQ